MKRNSQSKCVSLVMQPITGHVHVINSVIDLLLTWTAPVRSHQGQPVFSAAAVVRCCVYVALFEASP